MKPPKSISPCPIREAVAEVRFEPNVPADAVFGIVYQALKREFPKANPLPILALPTNFRNTDKDLAFQPHYRLENETAVVLIGPKVIVVGMRGDYPGWAAHSQRIKGTLSEFHRTGILARTLRFGLRYISFFAFDIYPNLLLRITVDETSLDGEETLFKTVLTRKGCKTLLQVGKGLSLVNKPSESGSVIDIDSFVTEIGGEFIPALDHFLEQAHHAEKELFFSLLRPDFLKTLNPIYDDAN
jgi:uncharacterized protein (TIGR04255 family)